jgi:hypothetical protein
MKQDSQKVGFAERIFLRGALSLETGLPDFSWYMLPKLE